MHPTFFIHYHLLRHQGWFYFIAIVTSAAIYMTPRISVVCWLGLFRWVVLLLVLWGASILISIVGVPICTLISNVQGLLLPMTLPIFVKGQLVGIRSLFPLCGSQELNSSHQVWLQVLSYQLSHLTHPHLFSWCQPVTLGCDGIWNQFYIQFLQWQRIQTPFST